MTQLVDNMIPYELALTYVGTREIPGPRSHPFISRILRRLASWATADETPWCSAFVDYIAAECGYESTGKLNARSWLEVGTPVRIPDVRQGDVVIFSRGNPQGWQGHVAFFHGWAKDGVTCRVLGGNQSNAVNITGYDGARIIGIRRLRTLERLERQAKKDFLETLVEK